MNRGAQRVPAAAAEILRAGRAKSPPTSFGKLSRLIGHSDLTAKRWSGYLGLDVTTHGQGYGQACGRATANHPVWGYPGASELARRLWDDPNYRTADIAAELVKLTGTVMKLTRNHVIGWAHRRFWPPKASRKFVRFGRTGPRARPDPIPPPPKPVNVATVRAGARDRIAQEEVVVGLFDEPQDVDRFIRRATRGSAKPLPVPGYRSPHRTCQWIEGNARPWRFCDEPADAGRSYCAAHHEAAHVRRADAA